MAMASVRSAEEQAILRDGPFCAFARWVDHPVTGRRVIQCRRFGSDAQAWLGESGRACVGCKESAQFDGRPDVHERSEKEARRIALVLGEAPEQAEARLAYLKDHWRLDDSPRAQALLTRALQLAPAHGVAVAEAVRIARARGLIQ